MCIDRFRCIKIGVALGCTLVLSCSHLYRRPPAVPVFREDDVDRVIATLAARQNNLQNFKARVRFTIESPDLDEKRRFRGNLAVEMPDKLRLVSSGAFGRKLFDLISVGKSFLLHFPSERQVFLEKEGLDLESLPFSVSPSDIAKEFFSPEDWERMDLDNVRLVSPGGEHLTIAIHFGDGLRRKLWIERRRWWLMRDELYGEDGALRAITVLDRYRQIGGIWLPTYLEADYPMRETRMVMRLANVDVNTELNPKLFVFPEKLVAIAQRQRQSKTE